MEKIKTKYHIVIYKKKHEKNKIETTKTIIENYYYTNLIRNLKKRGIINKEYLKERKIIIAYKDIHKKFVLKKIYLERDKIKTNIRKIEKKIYDIITKKNLISKIQY